MMTDTPPQNIDAEQSVLGCILIDYKAMYTVAQYLKPADFYSKKHKLIYDALLEMELAGKLPDMVTLPEYLRARGVLEQAGGVHYITTLSMGVPSAANVKAYVEIVKEKSVRRQLIKNAMIIDQAARKEVELEKVMRSAVDFLTMEIKSNDVLSFGEELDQWRQRIFDKDHAKAIPTDLVDIDSHLAGGGLRCGDVIIMGGLPSQGKTSLSLYIASRALWANKAVLIVSTDDSKDDIMLKMICLGRDLPYKNVIDHPDLYQDEIDQAISMHRDLKLTIDYHPGVTVQEIMALAKRLHLQGMCDLLIIDYFQHIDHQQRRGESEVNAKSRSSVGIKNLAQMLNIPILEVSQLARRAAERPGGQAKMQDLRETGQLEQDGSVIILLNKPFVKGPYSTIIEARVVKQKRGPKFKALLGCRWETGEFMDLQQGEKDGFRAARMGI